MAASITITVGPISGGATYDNTAKTQVLLSLYLEAMRVDVTNLTDEERLNKIGELLADHIVEVATQWREASEVGDALKVFKQSILDEIDFRV